MRRKRKKGEGDEDEDEGGTGRSEGGGQLKSFGPETRFDGEGNIKLPCNFQNTGSVLQRVRASLIYIYNHVQTFKQYT